MASGQRSTPPGHSTQPKSGLTVTALKIRGSSNFRNTPPRRSGSTGKIPFTPSLKVTFNRQSGSGSAETIRFMSLFYSNGGILEGS